jgi:anti-sigma B factor antagonist
MAERLFYLRGEIDVFTAPALHSELGDAIAFNDADLLVDCGELTFIDSSGLAVLVACQRNLQVLGRQLRIANATKATERVMQVAGLTGMLRVNDASDSGEEATG